MKLLLSREEIDEKIVQLARQISEDYEDKFPVLVGTLKGSFIFFSDLVRKLTITVEIEFVRLSSYVSGKETTGKIRILHGMRAPVKGRHVLVIEDIVDSGLTARFLLDYLARRKPLSLKLCTLLDKPSRRQVEVPIDYVGFTVPNEFLVGCGLDLDEKFRQLPDIWILD